MLLASAQQEVAILKILFELIRETYLFRDKTENITGSKIFFHHFSL
jgi:hypothetical protein